MPWSLLCAALLAALSALNLLWDLCPALEQCPGPAEGLSPGGMWFPIAGVVLWSCAAQGLGYVEDDVSVLPESGRSRRRN